MAVSAILSLMAVAYQVDPEKCVAKLTADKTDECFEYGAMPPGIGPNGETCNDCLMKIPGIETWGCTLSEMREFCNLAYEGAPTDLAEEEKHRNSTFVPVEQFNAAHTEEVAKMKKELNKAISKFAILLQKFDKAHPMYTKEETSVIGDILDLGMNTSSALKAVRDRNKAGSMKHYDGLLMASMEADIDFQKELGAVLEESQIGTPSIVDQTAATGISKTGKSGSSKTGKSGSSSVKTAVSSLSPTKAPTEKAGKLIRGIGLITLTPHHHLKSKAKKAKKKSP
jgi:hypothetical protein